ncbi:MAG: histidine phosphatase family protein [Alphaproteobacteria bacterium]|jgi:probable phosphoglycerate mutase|nr:histidine phosphatase family protein [Beijerinckiaceae bacterium]NBQ38674.1 histidine phosphatase family protein [Alphaproteobacteria bacterium]
MLDLPRILFVRHGETDWNVEGRLQGQTDIPLNALGRYQSEDVARRLTKLLDDPATSRWIVSPLGRTRETAEIARRTLGLDPNAYDTEDRLKEITFGIWEGSTWAELRGKFPTAEAERDKDKWGYIPPKGESYEMLVERLRPWLETIREEAVVVSHGGVARALMAVIADVAPQEAPRHEIHQGRVLVFENNRFKWH